VPAKFDMFRSGRSKYSLVFAVTSAIIGIMLVALAILLLTTQLSYVTGVVGLRPM